MNGGLFVLAVLFAVAGYGEAKRARTKYGQSPFGWPPLVWAVVFFLSWLLGLILLAIGARVLRRKAQRPPNAYTQVVPVTGYGYPPYAYGTSVPQGYGAPVAQGYGDSFQQGYAVPAQQGYGVPPMSNYLAPPVPVRPDPFATNYSQASGDDVLPR